MWGCRWEKRWWGRKTGKISFSGFKWSSLPSSPSSLDCNYTQSTSVVNESGGDFHSQEKLNSKEWPGVQFIIRDDCENNRTNRIWMAFFLTHSRLTRPGSLDLVMKAGWNAWRTTHESGKRLHESCLALYFFPNSCFFSFAHSFPSDSLALVMPSSNSFWHTITNMREKLLSTTITRREWVKERKRLYVLALNYRLEQCFTRSCI